MEKNLPSTQLIGSDLENQCQQALVYLSNRVSVLSRAEWGIQYCHLSLGAWIQSKTGTEALQSFKGISGYIFYSKIGK